jgi:peptidoglycan/LPS O-acetylase OafA/YrhL
MARDTLLMTSKYRPDIDGLRALAVIPVVLYHIGFTPIRGGFVGVDVFFVISGYLMASILLSDITNGRFSIVGFYERRIRRILPAFSVMAAFCLLVALVMMLPQDLKEFGTSVWSATAFASNIAFWIERGSYFDTSEDLKPLLHTWSLGVEEQFYIFFPVGLALVVGLWRLRTAFVLCALVAILSFALSVYATQHASLANFYLLPTRVWELLCGSLLAFGIIPSQRNVVVTEWLSAIGLALILIPIFSLSPRTPFPGLSALSPVLGAALIVYLGGGAAPTFVECLLALPAIRFVGLISYSLYLWHWPLIAFARYYWIELTSTSMVLLAVLSFAVAIPSWRYIEAPLRRRGAVFGRRRLFAVAGTISATLCAIGLMLYKTDGLPHRLPTDIANMAEKGTYHGRWRDCGEDYSSQRTAATLCVLGSAKAQPSFLLAGDSHAEAVAAALFESGESVGRAGYQITDTGYRPFLGYRKWGEVAKYEYLNRLIIEILDRHAEIRDVVIPFYWRQATLLDTYVDDHDRRVSGISATKLGLTALFSRYPRKRFLLIISGPHSPSFGGNPAARARWFGHQYAPVVEKAAFEAEEAKYSDVILALGEMGNVTIARLSDYLCDQHECYGILNGNIAYSDDNHVSYSTSRLLDPQFRSFLCSQDLCELNMQR